MSERANPKALYNTIANKPASRAAPVGAWAVKDGRGLYLCRDDVPVLFYIECEAHDYAVANSCRLVRVEVREVGE